MSEHLGQTETIIFGGAFNPPTRAHQMILEACVDLARDRQADVWLMPSGNRTDKLIPTDRETRLRYVYAMIADVAARDVAMRVDTSELDRPVMVETYDSVQELAGRYPDRQFRWVFGADSMQTMLEWKGGDWLLHHLDKLVVNRLGSVIHPLAERVVELTVDTPDFSSTEVRRRMAANEPLDTMVSAGVLELIGR